MSRNRLKSAFWALLLLTVGLSPAVAQQKYDLNNFEGLKSEGPVPTDLRLSLEELYSLDKQRVRDYNDGKMRNRDKVLAASYQIHRTMASGRIVYGDPITRMVERIADTLLKDYPSLRSELRFYTIKSPEVNAFATGQGMVFVCTGLVAQVEDESQLAFIISHEIIHYLRKHSLEEISRRKHDSDDIDAETQEMRAFIKYHNRSREMESEADSLGLTMFYSSSPYDKNVSQGVFDVLQYGYLPFDELPFDSAFFNTPYFKLPPDYFMKSVDPITARDDYNDSLSTHPNILKRRKATSSILSGYKGGNRFVMVSKEEFEEIRALARLECVRQDLIYSEYVRAFYDCYLLKKLYPDNQYVERAMCQALYGLSKFKTFNNTSSVVGDYKDFEGEVQQCYYLFRRITKEDLILVAAHQLWLSHCKYPEDKQITKMTEDLFSDLYVKYKWNADYFLSTPPAEEKQDTATEKLSKYERLKLKKNRQQTQDRRAYAFTDLLMQNEALGNFMKEYLKEPAKNSQETKPEKKNQLVYCPSYYVVSKIKGELNIRKSVQGENTLFAQINDAASKNGIGSIDFSDQSLHDIDNSDRYNEWVDINEWVGEFWQTKGDFDMQLTMLPKIENISDKYDAGSVNMSIVLNRENLVNRKGSGDIWYIWILPLTPLSINNMISHNEATMVYSIQLDATTGKQQSKHVYVYDLCDESARVRSSFYDHFLHIFDDSLTRTPGYMGSRWNVVGSVNMGFGRLGLLGALFSDSETQKVPLFNYGADAELSFTVKRSRSLQLKAGFLPMKFIEQNSNEAFKMNQLSLSLGWRVYEHLAPLGYYWQVGADVAMLKLPNPPINFEEANTAYGLHLEMGRNHIFNDHIVFGYYVRYTVLANYLTKLMELDKGMERNAVIGNFFRMGVNFGFQP